MPIRCACGLLGRAVPPSRRHPGRFDSWGAGARLGRATDTLTRAALVEPTALEGECTRLVPLGARRVRRLEADGINAVCLVIQAPEGNEFCLD